MKRKTWALLESLYIFQCWIHIYDNWTNSLDLELGLSSFRNLSFPRRQPTRVLNWEKLIAIGSTRPSLKLIRDESTNPASLGSDSVRLPFRTPMGLDIGPVTCSFFSRVGQAWEGSGDGESLIHWFWKVKGQWQVAHFPAKPKGREDIEIPLPYPLEHVIFSVSLLTH